jgi:hypothetical protein
MTHTAMPPIRVELSSGRLQLRGGIQFAQLILTLQVWRSLRSEVFYAFHAGSFLAFFLSCATMKFCVAQNSAKKAR